MSNLIPIEHQKESHTVRRARFVIVASLFATVLALVAFAALIPSYLVARSGLPVASANQNKTRESSNDRAQIAETTSLAHLLSPFVVSTTTPSDVILAALAKRPAGITIDNISYTADPSGQIGKLVFSGAAKSSDLISSYRNALTADTRFTSVSVPVDALIGSKDGRFTMTLEANL